MATLSPEEHKQLMIETAGPWVPQDKGEFVAGTVVGVLHTERNHPEYGYLEYPRIVLNVSDDPDPEVFDYLAVHVIGQVLTNKIEEMRPSMGQRLVFMYNGTRESASGKRYADMSVTDGTPSKAYEWGAKKPPVMPAGARDADVLPITKGRARTKPLDDEEPPF